MKNESSSPTPRDYLQGEPIAIARRNLTEDTCRKWGYWCGVMNGEPVQIANY
jgi:twinkle protein